MWDVIVAGSGISALTAALSRSGQKVLVLEQHYVAGEVTRMFQRGDWHFATRVHYLSGMEERDGEGGQFRRLLGWLAEARRTSCRLRTLTITLRSLIFLLGLRIRRSGVRQSCRRGFRGRRKQLSVGLRQQTGRWERRRRCWRQGDYRGGWQRRCGFERAGTSRISRTRR